MIDLHRSIPLCTAHACTLLQKGSCTSAPSVQVSKVFSPQLLLLGRTKVFWHHWGPADTDLMKRLSLCHSVGKQDAISLWLKAKLSSEWVIHFWSHEQIGKSASEGVLRWFQVITRQHKLNVIPFLENHDMNTGALGNVEPQLIDDVRKNTANICIFSNGQFKRRILSSSFTSIS